MFLITRIISSVPQSVGTMCKNMSMANIYEILLYVAHAVYSLVEVAHTFCAQIVIKLRHIGRRRLDERERKRISTAADALDKVPRHVVLVLGNEQPSYIDLGRLVVWCTASGIPFVSFYDHTGALKNGERLLHEELSSRGCSVVREAAGGMRCARPGGRTSVRVTLLSSAEGRGAVAALAREWSRARVPSAAVRTDLIDEGLRRRSGTLPDPDLALCCGRACRTNGLLPWQVRLTEFVHVRTHCSFPADTFISALQFYGRCEQRFGK